MTVLRTASRSLTASRPQNYGAAAQVYEDAIAGRSGVELVGLRCSEDDHAAILATMPDGLRPSPGAWSPAFERYAVEFYRRRAREARTSLQTHQKEIFRLRADEIRSALTVGPSTVDEICARLGRPKDVVRHTLSSMIDRGDVAAMHPEWHIRRHNLRQRYYLTALGIRAQGGEGAIAS